MLQELPLQCSMVHFLYLMMVGWCLGQQAAEDAPSRRRGNRSRRHRAFAEQISGAAGTIPAPPGPLRE